MGKKKQPKFSDNIERSPERIKRTGEIFTPKELVREVLEKLPEEVFKNPTKTFLDNSCGTGNFLVEVLGMKIYFGSTMKQALSTTYGVELMQDNVNECRARLLRFAATVEGITFEQANEKYGEIVSKNVVCADALTYDYSFDEPSAIG